LIFFNVSALYWLRLSPIGAQYKTICQKYKDKNPQQIAQQK